MAKTIFTSISSDHTTGEILTSKFIKKEVKNTEAFIRTYIEDLGLLVKCSGAEQKIILSLLKYLDYNTNRLYIDNKRRLEIGTETGLKEGTINVCIPRLVRKGILIKESSAAFVLNPKLFFFGKDTEREKVFSLIVQYEIKD